MTATARPLGPAEALQETLAAEHAAVYAFGVLGGRWPATEHPDGAALLQAAYATHRARRDQLRTLVADTGAEPTAPAAGYALTVPGRAPDRLLAVARSVEARCATVYAQLVASSVGTTRGWAVDALVDAAARQLALGGAPAAFPGAPELG